MATGQLNGVIQNLRRTALQHGNDGLTDGQLVDEFLKHADEAAFEALVHRHGPMVWGVCLRVLGRSHDAEDAFQAAFLVLVRKADSIRPREMVGNWLYGVAYRTALKAKGVADRRRAREKQVEDMPAKEVLDSQVWSDLRPLLDCELNRLADRYRVPVVLCDLEGKSQREAARQLGWPDGTLTTRLTRARKMLARRLSQQGVALSASALALALSQNAAPAMAPAPLVVTTVKAAALIAAGQAATSAASAPVAALLEGVLQAMFLTKIKSMLVVVLAVALVGSSAGIVGHRVLADASRDAGRIPAATKPVDVRFPEAAPLPDGAEEFVQGRERAGGDDRRQQEVRGLVKSVDATAFTITIQSGGGRETAPAEKTYALAKNVEVAVGAGGGLRGGGGILKEAKLADLIAGTPVSLSLGSDQKTVDAIVAEEPVVRGILKSTDLKKGTLTIERSAGRGAERGERAPPNEEKTYTIAAHADVAVDDGRGQRYSIHEGKLDDLVPGAIVTLRLSLDKQSAHSITAEGATITGVIKELDAAKRSLTLTIRAARGDEAAEERSFAVAKDAFVTIDNGKGRRLSIKEAKLADVPVGAAVAVKLGVDQTLVMQLRAEAPSLTGLLKAVNPAKGEITITIPRGRAESDDKTLTLAKDARITLDGIETKLGDLKPTDNGPHVQLRLTFDQTAVQSVTARQPGTR